jgi:PEP-CTERM motif
MTRRRLATATTLLGLAAGLISIGEANATLYGPSPYLSFSDRPFTAPTNAYYYLEDFEDGALSTTGVTVSAGVVAGPSALTDSVDADNGPIDGSGTSGNSWYSNFATSSFSFTFNSVALGGVLPNHAGIVWTDVGAVTEGTTGFGSVTFEAFGPANESLGIIGPVLLGDGVATGTTAEDRFFGASHAAGISRIVISTTNTLDWEVDHLQYADLRIPEPTAIALAGIALMGCAFAGRRQRI